MTISRCWETAAGFSQNMSSLSPGPYQPLLYDSGPSPLIHITAWPWSHLSSRSGGEMTVKALAIPIIYWISITSMAISTKIKANIFSLKSSSVYEHLSHKFSAHVKFWGQEPLFFLNKEGVKPPTKQTRFPFQQVPYWASWESLEMFSASFCFFLTLGNRVRLDFLNPWHVRTRE